MEIKNREGHEVSEEALELIGDLVVETLELLSEKLSSSNCPETQFSLALNILTACITTISMPVIPRDRQLMFVKELGVGIAENFAIYNQRQDENKEVM